jgi:hypothetical protein
MKTTTLVKFNNGIKGARPMSIASEIGLNTSRTNENALNNYVYEEFKKWGFAPYSPNLFPIRREDAKYPSDELLSLSIIRSYFYNFVNSKFGKPSKEKLDASSLAIRMGYPGQLGRSGLNAYVVGELNKLGLTPYQGRHGAISLGIGLNIFDGGVYPTNNPVVKRIIKEFFEDIQGQCFNGKAEKYAIRISA